MFHHSLTPEANQPLEMAAIQCLVDTTKTTCWSSKRASEWGGKKNGVTLNVVSMAVGGLRAAGPYWEFHNVTNISRIYRERSKKRENVWWAAVVSKNKEWAWEKHRIKEKGKLGKLAQSHVTAHLSLCQHACTSAHVLCLMCRSVEKNDSP